MNTTLRASLILVALVTALNLFVLASGLNRSFVTGQVVFLAGAIAFNIGVIYWALKRDASTKGYGLQLVTALGIGLLAGFLIVMVSWFLLAVVFPDALAEMRQGALEYLEATGTPADELERQREELERATPFSQAAPGFLGTLLTSLVSGGILAIFLRKK